MSIHSAKTLSASSPSTASVLGKLGQSAAAGKALDGELSTPVFAKLLQGWTPPPQRIAPAPPPVQPTSMNRPPAPATPATKAESAPKAAAPAPQKERVAERSEASRPRPSDAHKAKGSKDSTELKEAQTRKRPTGPGDDAADPAAPASQAGAQTAVTRDEAPPKPGAQADGQTAADSGAQADRDAHASSISGLDPALLSQQRDLAKVMQQAATTQNASTATNTLGSDRGPALLQKGGAGGLTGRAESGRFSPGGVASAALESLSAWGGRDGATALAGLQALQAEVASQDAGPSGKDAGSDPHRLRALRADPALVGADPGKAQDLVSGGKISTEGLPSAKAEALSAGLLPGAAGEAGHSPASGPSFSSLLQAASTLPGSPLNSPNGSSPTPTNGLPVALQTPLMEPGFAPEMAARLSLLTTEGVQRAELHLNPAEMGPVSVQIAVDGLQAQVQFHAQHEATREVLERSLPELAAALRDAGMTLSGGGVFQQAREGQGNGGKGEAAPAAGQTPMNDGGDRGLMGGTPLDSPRRPLRGVLDTYA